jgi:O-antigen/teichoic acid export membrane protein
MLSAAKRYSRFPRFALWASLCNGLSRQLPFLVLAHFFGAATAGFFALGAAVLGRPVTLLGRSLGQVFFQEASARWQRQEDLVPLLWQMAHITICLSVGPLVALTLFGESVFGALFGARWIEAGRFAAILSGFYFTHLLFAPVSNVVNVWERQDIGLFFQLGLLGLRLVGLVLGGLRSDVTLAVALYSLGGGAAFLLLGVWVMRRSGLALRRVGALLGRCIVSALVPILGAWWILRHMDGFGLPGLLMVALALVLYYLIIGLTDPELRRAVQTYVLDRRSGQRRETDDVS